MECREARELVHAGCDSELASEDRRGLTGHLSECPACVAYEKAMRSLKGRMRAVASAIDVTVAEAVFERIIAAPARGPLGGLFSAGFFRLGVAHAVAAAALLAALIFAGMSFFKPTESMASVAVRHHRLRLVGRLVLDTHANCCKDLEEWFESRSGRPVHVPELTYKDIKVEGGYYYKHPSGNSMYLAAYSLENKPVTLCVCIGPNIITGTAREIATVEVGDGYTSISWLSGGVVNVLITPFDEAKSWEIFASIK